MKKLILPLFIFLINAGIASATEPELITLYGHVNQVMHPVRKIVFSYSVNGKEKSVNSIVKDNIYESKVTIDEQQIIP